MRGLTLLDHSKLARDFVIQITNFCSFYYDHIPLIWQRNALAGLVNDVSFKHWDLGSIPRSPIFPYNFCYNVLLCSFHSNDHHEAQRLGTPHVPEDQSSGHHKQSTMDTSQPLLTQTLKVNMGLHFNGLNCSNITSKLGQPPPSCLYFFLSFFFFFFIICFNLIIFF